MELSSHKLKKLSYFTKELAKLEKKKKIHSKEFSFILLTEKFLMLFRCVLNTTLLFCVIKCSYKSVLQSVTKNFSMFRTQVCQLLFDVSAIL